MVDAPQAWFSILEAARYARCSRSLIYSLLQTGALRARKLGGRTLVKRDELDALIEAGSP